MDPLQLLSEAVLRENLGLCSEKARASGQLVPVREFLHAAPVFEKQPAGATGPAKPVTKEANGRTLHLGQIGESDVFGGNGRAYPTELWQQQLDRLGPLLESGFFTGAVDHLGYHQGGNLKHTPIIHREVFLEGTKVMSWYQIVEKHTDGANLKALKDAGMSIGWSTYGYGLGRPAEEADKEKYRGIPKEADLSFDPEQGPRWVVMQAWRLTKADAVDDPSFVNARDTREANEQGLLTAEQLKGSLAVTGATAPVLEGAGARGSTPPERSLTQYTTGKGGDVFAPEGELVLKPKLDAHAYRAVMTWMGPRFIKMRPETDELYRFSGSAGDTVLKEIADFWSAETRARYAEFNILYNRGILLEGPPGTGKTAALHQTAEQVVSEGDVVFYSNNIGSLTECLNAFREVEPQRRVVVCLEDADEYIGYQERAFLQLLDGEQSLSGVLYLATTNYAERFPPRLLRPGRFDKRVRVGPPPVEGRQAYLEAKLKGKETTERIAELARVTDGLSFGHLRELITAIYVLKEPAAEVIKRLTAGRRPAGSARESVAVESLPWRKGDGVPAEGARLKVASEAGATGRLGNQPQETVQMKTLAELKEKYPDLFKLHEEAIANAIATATTELTKRVTAAETSLANIEKVLNGALPVFKDNLGGLKVPERLVEDGVLKTQVETLTAQLATANAEKATAAAALATATAEKAEGARKDAVRAKLTEKLADNAYAGFIKPLAEKRLADKAFDAAAVEAFVAEKTAEYTELKVPAPGKTPAQPEATDEDDLGLAEGFKGSDDAGQPGESLLGGGGLDIQVPEGLAKYAEQVKPAKAKTK